MAGRKPKKKVDYFPHVTKHGRTMFILEERFGNDGYAFWFKLLETLGDSEGHFYSCISGAEMQYLTAKCHVNAKTGAEILDLLAELGAIDAELWALKVVWCQNFVDGLAAVYEKRKEEIPAKPSVCDISGAEMPFPVSEIHIVEESIAKQSRGEQRAREASLVSTRFPPGSLEASVLAAFSKLSPATSDPGGNLDAIPELVRLATSLGPPGETLPRMIDAYHGLVSGSLNGIGRRDAEFWAKQPLTPKAMRQVWDRLVGQVRGKIAESKTRTEAESNPFVTGDFKGFEDEAEEDTGDGDGF